METTTVPSLISLKSTATTGISDRDIVTRLRPIVHDVEEVQDSLASLCSSLEKLDFLQFSGDITSSPKDAILEQVNAVYLDAWKREAAMLDTYTQDGKAIQPKY
jgi:hypothetical protein